MAYSMVCLTLHVPCGARRWLFEQRRRIVAGIFGLQSVNVIQTVWLVKMPAALADYRSQLAVGLIAA